MTAESQCSPTFGKDGGAEQRQDAGDAGACVYQIRVRGHLDRRWSGWLEGMAVVHQLDGTTLLTGRVADQPALHGLLIKIRDLGLPLVSVTEMRKEQE